MEEDGRAVVRVTITSDVAAVRLLARRREAAPRGSCVEHTAPMVVYQEISAGARGFVVCDGAGRGTPKAGAGKREDEASRGPRKISRLGSRKGERIV